MMPPEKELYTYQVYVLESDDASVHKLRLFCSQTKCAFFIRDSSCDHSVRGTIRIISIGRSVRTSRDKAQLQMDSLAHLLAIHLNVTPIRKRLLQIRSGDADISWLLDSDVYVHLEVTCTSPEQARELASKHRRYCTVRALELYNTKNVDAGSKEELVSEQQNVGQTVSALVSDECQQKQIVWTPVLYDSQNPSHIECSRISHSFGDQELYKLAGEFCSAASDKKRFKFTRYTIVVDTHPLLFAEIVRPADLKSVYLSLVEKLWVMRSIQRPVIQSFYSDRIQC